MFRIRQLAFSAAFMCTFGVAGLALGFGRTGDCTGWTAFYDNALNDLGTKCICATATLYQVTPGGDVVIEVQEECQKMDGTAQPFGVGGTWATALATGTYKVIVEIFGYTDCTKANQTNFNGDPGRPVFECVAPPSECQWCNKGAVLSQVGQNIGGDICGKPDIIVDLRPYADTDDDGDCTTVDPAKTATAEPATCSLQSAVDYINANGDLNGDGFLFIGVIATDCESTPGQTCSDKSRPPAGGSPYGVENVIVTNERPERLNIFGCSVTLRAKDASKPVVTIQDSYGKVTVLDIHVEGSDMAGYLILPTNDDLVVVKNSRAQFNDIGYWILDNDVEVTGSGINDNRIGILLEGTGVVLRSNTQVDENLEDGILVTGNGNDIRNNGLEKNGANGIHVTGDGNSLLDNDTDMNFANGILATDDEGAANNELHGNSAEDNALHGILACGQIDDGGNGGQDNGLDLQVDFVCAEGPAVFFVADDQDDKVYTYNALVQNLGSFVTSGGNGAPQGVAVSGSDLYVLDKSDKQVYRYTTSGGTPAASRLLKDAAGGSLSAPTGLALAGNDLWLADDSKKKLYRYSLSSAFSAGGALNAAQEIAFSGDNDSVEGLAIDSTYLYVLDDSDKQIYRYPRSGGANTKSKTLKGTSGGGLNSPSGATIESGALWVGDRGNDKLYKYTLSSLFGTGSLNASSEAALSADNGDARGL